MFARHLFVELPRLTARNTQCLPLIAGGNARQEDDLPDVHRDVRDIPEQRFEHRHSLAANRYGAHEVFVAQPADFPLEDFPTASPGVVDLGA
jgi:hypothetical protein